MFEKSFLKKVKLSFLITLSTLVLLGCGGEDRPSSSGGSTPPSNNGGTNPPDICQIILGFFSDFSMVEQKEPSI